MCYRCPCPASVVLRGFIRNCFIPVRGAWPVVEVFSDGLYLYTLPMSFLEAGLEPHRSDHAHRLGPLWQVHRFDLATFQIYQKLDLSSRNLDRRTRRRSLRV